jgi:hypothetical protein
MLGYESLTAIGQLSKSNMKDLYLR